MLRSRFSLIIPGYVRFGFIGLGLGLGLGIGFRFSFLCYGFRFRYWVEAFGLGFRV